MHSKRFCCKNVSYFLFISSINNWYGIDIGKCRSSFIIIIRDIWYTLYNNMFVPLIFDTVRTRLQCRRVRIYGEVGWRHYSLRSRTVLRLLYLTDISLGGLSSIWPGNNGLYQYIIRDTAQCIKLMCKRCARFAPVSNAEPFVTCRDAPTNVRFESSFPNYVDFRSVFYTISIPTDCVR